MTGCLWGGARDPNIRALYFKGFVKEFFSLLSYLGGFLMASRYQGVFSHILMETIPSMAIAKVIAFVIIYILTVFLKKMFIINLK